MSRTKGDKHWLYCILDILYCTMAAKNRKIEAFSKEPEHLYESRSKTECSKYLSETKYNQKTNGKFIVERDRLDITGIHCIGSEYL